MCRSTLPEPTTPSMAASSPPPSDRRRAWAKDLQLGRIGMSDRHAVVVGGLGVIGRSLIDHLAGDPSWDVVALSRRAPDFETTARFLSVDLRERHSATAALAQLKKTTHVFYAAY